MATCPTCGAAEPEGSSFCGNCGSALGTADPAPPEPALATVTCPSCGSEEPEGSRFCGTCGATFAPCEAEAEEPVTELQPPAAPSFEAAPAPQPANNPPAADTTHHHHTTSTTGTGSNTAMVPMLPASTHGPTQTGSVRQAQPAPANAGTTTIRRRNTRSRGVVEDAPF